MSLLWWAIVTLAVTLVAGVLGFTGVDTDVTLLAKVLFGAALCVFVGLLILMAAGVDTPA